MKEEIRQITLIGRIRHQLANVHRCAGQRFGHAMTRVLVKTVFVITGLLAANSSMALTCSANASEVRANSSGTYTVPRDAQVGTVFTGWFRSGLLNFSCTDFIEGRYFGVGGWSTLQNTGMTVVADGKSFPVFATDLAGVGMIVRMHGCGNFQGGPPLPASPTSVAACSTGAPIAPGARRVVINFTMAFSIAFVKTAAITPGRVSGGRLGTMAAGQNLNANGGNNYNYSLNSAPTPMNFNSIDVVVGTCATPNITVPLGSYRSSQFTQKGPNSATQKQFNLAINDCSNAIKNIKVQFDTLTPAIDAKNGIFALDTSSRAKGVGVQLLNRDGMAMALATNYQISEYTGNGGSLVMPLQARYYQTENQVSPGKANATLMFTMTYQ